MVSEKTSARVGLGCVGDSDVGPLGSGVLSSGGGGVTSGMMSCKRGATDKSAMNPLVGQRVVREAHLLGL